MRDYYEILGIEREADGDSIKRAYRKLALKHHPDRNPGSTEAEDLFKEATEAYEVLRDPDKRAAYDRFGHAGVKAGAGAGFTGFGFADALEIFMRDFGGFGGMEEILMGGRRSRRSGGRARGADLRVRLPLTLVEVANGVQKTLKIRLQEPCDACAGTGAAQGSKPVRCSTCGGAGEVRRVQRSFLGQLVSVTACPACNGEGQRVEQPCNPCGGRGVQMGERTFNVDVPAGVNAGDYITLRGQGNAAPREGERGDILVVLEVEEDPRFLRDGADLVYELALTFTQAALGADVEVPTVSGTTRIKIAPGTQSGHLLRLRGKGLPQLQSSGRGDMIVRVSVWTPTELTPPQEELLKQLAEVESAVPERRERDGERGFWSKVREAFGG
ncbi:MAG: molecular chaperone DnaJ [Longimicrobiales bacterium]